jgi:hypothetical protein
MHLKKVIPDKRISYIHRGPPVSIILLIFLHSSPMISFLSSNLSIILLLFLHSSPMINFLYS